MRMQVLALKVVLEILNDLSDRWDIGGAGRNRSYLLLCLFPVCESQ